MEAELRRHRWTVEDVMHMVASGVLDEHAPVELIDGELIEMSPQGPRHRMSTVRIHRALEAAFGPAFYVQDHSPVYAGPASLPEPDVAVVRGPERFDTHPGPDEVVLVVEIAFSSHSADRAKAAVYAAAGFPELWLIDLVARRIDVHRHPHRDHREYGQVVIHREGDAVAAGETLLDVAELLPPP